MLFKASAPGSLMLLGEYAVLHGKHALACAIDKRITVTLEPLPSKKVEIVSPLGQLQANITSLRVEPPFHFVLATIKSLQKQLPSGFKLTIESEFSHTVGLGSSAAITVASLAALHEWLVIPFAANEFIKDARSIIQKVQGRGSGTDIAACTLGGMVAYKMQPLRAEKIAHHYPLTAIYMGYKTPTAEAIQIVKTQYLQNKKLFKQLFSAIDACVQQGIAAARQGNWAEMGKMMNIQQSLMEALGVSTFPIANIIQQLREQNQIHGAKISGSGLGDCVIGLGNADDIVFSDPKMHRIPVAISQQGVTREKI